MDAFIIETARYFRGRYGTDIWNWWINQDHNMRARFVANRHHRFAADTMVQALETILQDEGIVPNAKVGVL